MDNWRKLQELSWSERYLLAQALLMLPLTSVGLRWIGFRRWQSVLSAIAPIAERPASNRNSNPIRHAQIATRMVKIAARYGPCRATCLAESLTLRWLLRRQGIESNLRIGVRTEDGRLAAHAWVEHCGLVLNDAADVHQRFAPFDEAVVPLVVEIQ